MKSTNKERLRLVAGIRSPKYITIDTELTAADRERLKEAIMGKVALFEAERVLMAASNPQPIPKEPIPIMEDEYFHKDPPSFANGRIWFVVFVIVVISIAAKLSQ